ncbi:acyl-CoA thioesterase [Loigolactobacillus binensis]|uniref:Acyl-CoA thioesterase n=1 Tax=Loigolactobacillus binensis TaxID=2559922 RepID=A0ABW3EH63_9LACO|nr:acyl-CoA thioesterase [Loigolactobacillus binensis]
MVKKSCQASLLVQQYHVQPQDLNSHQTLHGGRLLHWVDDQAALSARRFGHQLVVTGSVDRFDFIRPVPVATELTIHSFVSGVAARALEIYVYVLNEQHQLVASAFLSMVSMVAQPNWPQVQPESQLEQAVCAAYPQRYAANLAQRQANTAWQALL